MTVCYLSLGSNLDSPERQLHRAIDSLRSLKNSYLITIASFYPNIAWGLKKQPNFINTVICLFTRLPPHILLLKCQEIERKQKRYRHLRWGARTIDIDILFYGNRVINNSKLTIPHPRLLERDFVLIPLKEIASLADLPQLQNN